MVKVSELIEVLKGMPSDSNIRLFLGRGTESRIIDIDLSQIHPCNKTLVRINLD